MQADDRTLGAGAPKDDAPSFGEHKTPRAAKARLGRWLGAAIVSVGVAATAFAASVAAIETLKRRAEAVAAPAPTPPLAVAVAPARRETGYDALRRYAGRVEAAQTTALGFDRPGRVVEVTVDEGARVAAGAVIARQETDRLSASRARLEAERTRLEAQLALAQKTERRQSALGRRGFASGQRVDEAEANEATLTASLAALAAERAALEVDFADAALTAPFAGVVAARRVDAGAYVQPGQTVVDLVEASRPQARIGLPPEEARQLVVGAAYEIETAGRAATARLVALRPDLNGATRTMTALFDLDWPADAPPPPLGDVARLTSRTRVAADGLWVPLSALQEGVKGLWGVYVVVEDADGWRVAMEAAEALYVEGERAYIRAAIAEGAPMIVAGVNRVVRGQRVEPVPATKASGAGAVASEWSPETPRARF